MSTIDFPGSPSVNDTYTFNGRTWKWNGYGWETVSLPDVGYRFVETVYFTSSGTFSKASYPYLRAMRVRMVGGGGGGAGAAATSAGQVALGASGGGAAYAEKFLLASDLGASETVTVGSGGSGGSAGANGGSTGGTSTFTVTSGTNVTAAGGGSGGAGTVIVPPNAKDSGLGGTTTTGADLSIKGGSGPTNYTVIAGAVWPSIGGQSALGVAGNQAATASGAAGVTATGNGAGGNGGINAENQATARAGGTGGPGIVIVDLFG